MRKLIKHDLDFITASTYFRKHIDFKLTLTDLILQEVDLMKGRFYTELPENAKMEKLYNFSGGNILPSSKENWRFIKSLNTYGHCYPNTDEELAIFYKNYLEKDLNNFIILDECVVNKNCGDTVFLPNVKTFFQELQVYYILRNNNSIDEILSAAKVHGYAWHSLAVLGRGELKDSDLFITDNQNVILENIEYLVCGAYDGEAYMFWEKNKK